MSGDRFLSGLSVFFPAFNDAPSLPGLLERTFDTLRRVASDYEVIVVNDGSRDNTAEVLEELSRTYAPYLRVVTHPHNLGYGAALRSGFAAATKEYIFYTDGDSQYDPGELEHLLAAATPETALVNGYKIERSDPWHRKAIGWLYNSFARWLFRIHLRDIDCDFRLIRRDALRLDSLRSTGGTICVELVRALELSGAGVEEVPVHHYARQYGRSQFFRLRSLAVTFFQLCSVFFRLVLWPSLAGTDDAKRPDRFSWRLAALVLSSVTVLSVLAYARDLSLPFISDDYLQIGFAREYGPFSKWGALASDALYRCRATSLVFTYWLEPWAGLDPFRYGLASLALHILNGAMVFALGMWRPIGWRVAAVAACFFAVCQRHSEAVVWFAAVHELLLFFFAVAGFLFWVRWLERPARGGRWWLYAGSLVCYLLALLSKESAVSMVPLCVLAIVLHPARPWRRLWGLAPFAVAAGVYFALDYSARSNHLHFNDGTFSLTAPFLETLALSVGRLLWIWGLIALLLLLTRVERRWRTLVWTALAWMVSTLLPYSFLTYMPWVPSRHTYLASAGLALLVASGLVVFRHQARRWNRVWLVPLIAGLIVVHQCGYLWVVKHQQYANRARPTEELIGVAAAKGHVRAKCFPYAPIVARFALDLRLGASRPKLVLGPEAARYPDAVDFCNADANGVRY